MTVMSQVLAQLTTELTSFNTVKSAWTSKPLANFDEELPAAMAYLDAMESEPSPYMNETIQPCERRIAVLIVCAADDLEARQQEVFDAMVGFQLTDGAWEPFEHLAGNNIQINESIVWWRELYSARIYQQ